MTRRKQTVGSGAPSFLSSSRFRVTTGGRTRRWRCSRTSVSASARSYAFLREHEDHVAVRKVRTNKPLTSSDLDELGHILLENGIGTADDLQRAAEANHGLGLFVRSLVGLDRGAAKGAFASFLSGKTLTANQIEFVNMIVDHLTENGAMDPALLYSSPYTDFSPRGVDGLFDFAEAAEIVSILRSVSRSAAA
jgi:type I restriction enzyme, R subunit